MTWQELEKQVLQLPISDRTHLVQSLLASIQQETLSSIPANPTRESLSDLDPWTGSLVGVIRLEAEEQTTEVLLRKEGHRLILEPIRPGSLLSLLATLEEITENFSDVDEGLMLLDDITL
ncbi:antitoxin [Microseira sp. BLCC-F43]|uniref:antitoxin n=1 Tax=Microseira sp. BLCC-F43 TaxID=3153602 RepID=UPI0035BA68B5